MARSKMYCKGKNEDASECKNWAVRGSFYCTKHQHQVTSSDRQTMSQANTFGVVIALIIGVLGLILVLSGTCRAQNLPDPHGYAEFDWGSSAKSVQNNIARRGHTPLIKTDVSHPLITYMHFSEELGGPRDTIYCSVLTSFSLYKKQLFSVKTYFMDNLLIDDHLMSFVRDELTSRFGIPSADSMIAEQRIGFVEWKFKQSTVRFDWDDVTNRCEAAYTSNKLYPVVQRYISDKDSTEAAATRMRLKSKF